MKYDDYLGRNLDDSTTKIIDTQLTGKWHIETIPPDVTGLPRPVQVIRGRRAVRMFTFDWHGDAHTFCPPKWWDLAIGAGACGYGCRSCFLMLTHRAFNDPLRHRLYDNGADYYLCVARWLLAKSWQHPNQKEQQVKLNRHTTLGLGIDRSDSLLYEGVTGHARRLIPLFVNPETNPDGRRLVLLTKSANIHYLDWWRRDGPDFPDFTRAGRVAYAQHGHIPNVSVTFSLNPDPIADRWEGKYPDTLARMTPHIDRRLAAAKTAAELGFDVRWRLDPILPVDGWPDLYRNWLEDAVTRFNAQPSYITLGTYREKNPALDAWREKWGLPPMGWEPERSMMERDGTHIRLSRKTRMEIYRFMRATISAVWRSSGHKIPGIGLCKEPHALRLAVGMANSQCNCLACKPEFADFNRRPAGVNQ